VKEVADSKEIVIAFAGNPNSGKTTIFNELTGSRQHVGNWPGVTVERKEGVVRKNGYTFRVVDLPGIYSLSAYTQEEIVARDFYRINDIAQEIEKSPPKPRDLLIDDRRFCPFDDDGIAAECQKQSLAQIPAAGIDVAFDGELDDIARRLQHEMTSDGSNIDETAVIIAVGRRKSPGTAAAFDGEQDRHALGSHQIEARADCRDGLRRKINR